MGDEDTRGTLGRVDSRLGGTRMRWVLRLIATGEDDRCPSADLMEICRSVPCLQSHRDWRMLAIAMPIDAGSWIAAAHLSALMAYRVAVDVLQHLLPIDAGRSP
jgi:hypothetical protein